MTNIENHKKVHKALLGLIAFMVLNPLFGQKYNTLGGIRVGDDFGISAAQRIADKSTLDLTYQPGTFAGNKLILLTAKQHYPLLTKRLNFYIGGGLYHKTYENLFDNIPKNDVVPHTNSMTGIAFTLGAELTIRKLTIGADYVPLVHFGENSYRRFYSTSGLSLRYVFVERESKTKKFFKNIFKKNNNKKKKK